jgi:hypothetical protein
LRVTVLHVVEPPDDRVLHLPTTTAPKFHGAAQALIRVTKERGRQVLERVSKVMTHRGLTVHPLLVEGCPAEDIIRAAERARRPGTPRIAEHDGFEGCVPRQESRKVTRYVPARC